MALYTTARESAVLRIGQRMEMGLRAFLLGRSIYMVVLADNRNPFGVLGKGKHPTDAIRKALDGDGKPWKTAVYYFVRDSDMTIQGGVLYN